MLKKNPEYNIDCVNPLYLLIAELDGYVEEKEGNKYLNITFTDRNNEVLKNMQKFRAELKIKKINDGQLGEYGKDYMVILMMICL